MKFLYFFIAGQIMIIILSLTKLNTEHMDNNTEKYQTFSIPIEKEVIKIDKDGNESVISISCKINFTDSARFTAGSFSFSFS